jgi:hypothetical protein
MTFVAVGAKDPTRGLPGPAAARIFNKSDNATRMTAYDPDVEPVTAPPGVALGPGPVVSVGRTTVGEGVSGVAVGEVRGVGEAESCVGEGITGRVGNGVGVPNRDNEQPINGKSKTAASKASVVFFMVVLQERFVEAVMVAQLATIIGWLLVIVSLTHGKFLFGGHLPK